MLSRIAGLKVLWTTSLLFVFKFNLKRSFKMLVKKFASRILITTLWVVVLCISSVYSQGNSPPVFVDDPEDIQGFHGVTSREIAERLRPGTNVGDPVSATDADNDTITYSLRGTDASKFRINKSTGQLKSGQYFDYEKTNSWLVTVQASDEQLTTSIDVVIFVIDRPEFNVKWRSGHFVNSIFEHPDLDDGDHDNNSDTPEIKGSDLSDFYDSFLAFFGIVMIDRRKGGDSKVIKVGENLGSPIPDSIIDYPVGVDREDLGIYFKMSKPNHGRFIYSDLFSVNSNSGQLRIKTKIDFEKYKHRDRNGNGLIVLPCNIEMHDKYGYIDWIGHSTFVRNLDEATTIEQSDPNTHTYTILVQDGSSFSDSDQRAILRGIDPEVSMPNIQASSPYTLSSITPGGNGLFQIIGRPDGNTVRLDMVDGRTFDFTNTDRYVYVFELRSGRRLTYTMRVVFEKDSN